MAADPLSLLRHYNLNKKEIIERDGQIIFGEFSYSENVETNYVMWSGKDGTTKKYYTLKCLLYFLKTVSLIHPVYARQAAAENIPAVRRPDRKELLAFLNGEIDNYPAIDKSTLLKPAQVEKFANPDDCEKNIAKKPRCDDKPVEQKYAASKESSATNCDFNEKSLSDALSAEKIAAIKAKRLMVKKLRKKMLV